jgi:hypothetical protein
MIKTILDLLISKYAFSLIRHINTIIGTLLISAGAEEVVTNSFLGHSEQFWLGFLQVIASIIASFIEKKNRKV